MDKSPNPTSNSEKTWRDFEELIYNIYKQIEPYANVKHNDFILGVESNKPRQIDISIRSKIANHEILIIIQAKKLKKRADINVLGEFDSVIRDVRASKGVLICNAGFTKTCKDYAEKKKIDLCTAHDATNKEWQAEIQIPVIKKSIKVSLTIQHYYLPGKETTINNISMPYPEKAVSEFLKRWENNELIKEEGTHYVDLDKEAVKLPNSVMSIKTGIKYEIKHRYHFKFFKPVDYRGIRDYFSENFTPSFIEFKEKIPFLNDGSWDYVPSLDKISINTSHLQIEIVNIDFFKKEMIRVHWEDKR